MGSSSKKILREAWLLALLGLLAWVPAVTATPPSTPITLELALSHAPGLNEWATLTVTVSSVLDAPDTSVELILPHDVRAPTTNWIVDLRANIPVTLSSAVFVQTVGNLTLSARAIRLAGPGAVWGDMKAIPLHIGSPVLGPSERGWKISRSAKCQSHCTGATCSSARGP